MPKAKRLIPSTALGLLSRMGEDPADDLIVNRVHCGLHSGFPECCVVFFVKFWGPLMDSEDHEGMARYRAMIDRTCGPCGPGYVPCPRCLVERDLVAVRSCDCTRRRRAR